MKKALVNNIIIFLFYSTSQQFFAFYTLAIFNFLNLVTKVLSDIYIYLQLVCEFDYFRSDFMPFYLKF